MSDNRDRPPLAAAPKALRVAPPSEGLLRALLEAAAERGTEVRFEVDGGSMLPLVRPGDLVHLRTDVPATLRSGDVVAARGPDERGVLVHRAVSVEGKEAVLRGDNCPIADGRFALTDLIGMVSRVERRGKSVWFGSGRLGPVVAWAARSGMLWRVSRVVYGARRRLRACLKFGSADSRLTENEGDDGNE